MANNTFEIRMFDDECVCFPYKSIVVCNKFFNSSFTGVQPYNSELTFFSTNAEYFLAVNVKSFPPTLEKSNPLIVIISFNE